MDVRFGNGIYPMCRRLDDVDSTIVLGSVSLFKKMLLRVAGAVYLPEATAIGSPKLQVYLVRRKNILMFNYLQGHEQAFREWPM